MTKTKTIYPDPGLKRKIYLDEYQRSEFLRLNSGKYFIKCEDGTYLCMSEGKETIFWSDKKGSYIVRISFKYFLGKYQQLMIYLTSGQKTELEMVI